MIQSYSNFTQKKSLFSEDEKNLFEDLLTKYIDKYQMVEMPNDSVNNQHYFDSSLPRIQYLVQRLRNIGIDIESNFNISLNSVFRDLKLNFIPRVQKFGYHVYHCELKEYFPKNTISITIMQSNKNEIFK